MASKNLAFVALVGLAACGGAPEPEEARQPTSDDVARAKAFLIENDIGLPEGWSFETIPFEGHGHLRIGRATPAHGRATVVFVPGYTSSPELASDFLSRWFDLGFEVVSVDLPGQGGSVRREDDPHKTYTGDFGDYGAAVGTAVAHVAAVRDSAGPLILAGDSFGGHAILRAVADRDAEEVDALLPMVPAVLPKVEGVPLVLAEFVTGLAIRFGGGEDYLTGNGPWQPDQFRDEAYISCGNRPDRNFKNHALMTLHPELRVGGVSNEWAFGMVQSGQRLLTDSALAEFDKPMTFLTAGLDTIVENDAAERLCGRIESCQLAKIEEATHCLYLEDDPTQEKVHAVLLSLLGRLEGR